MPEPFTQILHDTKTSDDLQFDFTGVERSRYGEKCKPYSKMTIPDNAHCSRLKRLLRRAPYMQALTIALFLDQRRKR